MEFQQLAWAVRVRSHSGELDQMLYLGALRGFDKVLLPLNKAFRNRLQKKCLLNALQGGLQCFGLIKVAGRHLDVRPIELGSLGRLANEHANALSHRGKLADKFLSVISGCSCNQYHGLPPKFGCCPG